MNLIALFGAITLAQPLPAAHTELTVAKALPPLAAPTVAVARLPALTPLRLQVEGQVSSKTHVTGDKIVIILADALWVTDRLAIPAGTRGVGEVVHAAKKGMGGKPGELLIAARTLDLAPGVSIKLRSFRMVPANGKSNEGLATGMMIAGGAVGGIAALVTTGHSAVIADRAEAFAKTAADIDLPLSLLVPVVSSAVPLAAPAPTDPINIAQ